MHTQTAATLKQQSYSFQLITVGNPSVGKTSLIHRIAYQKFPETIEPTLAVSELPVVITTDKGNANISLYDTCGHEKYISLTRNYYKNADGILLMFDLTDFKSFESLKMWIKDIELNTDHNKLKEVIVIGNKSDCDNVLIKESLVRELLVHYNYSYYYEVSAKTGKGVQSAVKTLVRKLIEMTQNKDDFSVKHRDIEGKSIDSLGRNRKNNKCC